MPSNPFALLDQISGFDEQKKRKDEGLLAPIRNRINKIGEEVGALSENNAANFGTGLAGAAIGGPYMAPAIPMRERLLDAERRKLEQRQTQIERTGRDFTEITPVQRVSDAAVSLGSGASSTTFGLVGGATGIATGNFENVFNKIDNGIQSALDTLRSQGMQERRALALERIGNNSDGVLDEMVNTIQEFSGDSALLTDLIVSQVPQIALAYATGGASKAATAASLAKKGLTAAEIATKVAKVGERVAVGTAAVAQGADVANDTYQRLSGAGPDVWEQDSGYQKLVASGVAPEKAMEKRAGEVARVVGAASAALSGVLGKFMPTAEKAILGSKAGKTRIGNIAGTAAGEALSEGVEEGGGQLIQNIGARTVDPNISLTEGVGQAAGLGMLAGGPLGAGSAALGRETNVKPGEPNVVTGRLREAIDVARGTQPPADDGPARLSPPEAFTGTFSVGGLQMTADQVLSFAEANKDNNPRIAQIMSADMTQGAPVLEALVKELNTDEARMAERDVVAAMSNIVDGKTAKSVVMSTLNSAMSSIPQEVVTASPLLSQLSAMTDGKSTPKQIGQVISQFQPRTEGTVFARPERGGDGSVLMTQDQKSEEAKREREAEQSFRLAEARQKRYDQATTANAMGGNQQREDLRPGASEPVAQFVLADNHPTNPGAPATIVESPRDGYARVQYETGEVMNGMPVYASEEVPISGLRSRVVRGTARTTQDVASRQRKLRSGVGTQMEGPRNSIDRASTKQVTPVPEPGTAVEPYITESERIYNSAPEPTPEQVGGGVKRVETGTKAIEAKEPLPKGQERVAAPSRKAVGRDKRTGIEYQPGTGDNISVSREGEATIRDAKTSPPGEIERKGQRVIRMGDQTPKEEVAPKESEPTVEPTKQINLAKASARLGKMAGLGKTKPVKKSKKTDEGQFSRREGQTSTFETAPTIMSEEDAKAEIDRALEGLRGRGALGRVVANRISSVLKDKSYTTDQVFAAFLAGEEVTRVLKGRGDIDVAFVPSLRDRAGVEAQGKFVALPVGPNGFRGIITLSLAQSQIPVVTQTTAHEAFHALQKILRKSDPKTFASLNRSFRNKMKGADVHPSVKRVLQRTVNRATGLTFWEQFNKEFGDRTFWDESSPEFQELLAEGKETTDSTLTELQAYVFGYLHDAQRYGMERATLAAQFSKALDFFNSIFEAIGNALRGNGFTSASQIFADATSGELSNRLSDAELDGGDTQFSRRKDFERPKISDTKIKVPIPETSSLNILYDDGSPSPKLPTEKMNGGQAAKWIQDRAQRGLRRVFGVDKITGPSPETDRYLSRTIAAEAMAAILKELKTGLRSALDWYTTAVENAITTAAEIYPILGSDAEAARLSNSHGIRSKKDARVIFTLGMSITSQNMAVRDNTRAAVEQMDFFMENVRFDPSKRYGTKAPSIASNLKLANVMLHDVFDGNVSHLGEFLDKEFTVGELNAYGRQLQEKLGLEKPPFTVGGELVDQIVYGSAIFGPKIGNGFYQNLNGNFSPITIDLWFMRLWGRLTGTLVGNDAALTQQAQNLRDAVMADDHPTYKVPDGYAQQIEDATDEELVDIAASLFKEWDRTYKSLRKSGVSNEEITSQKMKPRWAFAAARLDAQKKANDAPTGGSQRKWIRSVIQGALTILKKNGYDLTAADLQAIIWYPEKDLHSLITKGRLEETLNVSYDTAVSEIAAQRKSNAPNPDDYAGRRNDDQRRGTGSGQADSGRGEEGAGREDAGQEAQYSRRATPSSDAQRELFGRLQSEFPTARLVRGGDDEQGNVSRKSGGVVSPPVGAKIPAKATYSHDSAYVRLLNEFGADAPDFYELSSGAASARAYRQLISNAKAADQFGAAVYVYDEAEYRNMRLFLTKDGGAGFALKGDDIVSAFKSPNSSDRLVAYSMIRMAVANGGRRLDAFDTVLPNLYSVNNFRVVSRTKWDDEYAPEDWDKQTFSEYNGGEPDVVFMVHDREKTTLYEPNEGNYAESYDAAVEAQAENVQYSRRETRPYVDEFRSVLNEADRSLPAEAASAITRYVGHVAGKIDNMSSDMDAVGFMVAHQMEDAFSSSPSAEGELVRQQLEKAFAPIREEMRSRFGDRVKLYRVQTSVDTGDDAANMSRGASNRRNVLSWSSDPNFSSTYAGVRRTPRVITDGEIDSLADQFDRDGEIKVPGTNQRWVLSRERRRKLVMGEVRQAYDQSFVSVDGGTRKKYSGGPMRLIADAITDGDRVDMSGFDRDAQTGNIVVGEKTYSFSKERVEEIVPGLIPGDGFEDPEFDIFEMSYEDGEATGDEELIDSVPVQNLREELVRIQEDQSENRAWREAKNSERSKLIKTADIPLDDVVWVTDRAGQAEFIVRNGGSARINIDETGQMSEQYSRRTSPPPQNTVTAYKLFRVNPRRPGQLFPLFVNANEPVPFGEWLDADVGPMSNGKVKSRLGPLAFRPGWHAGDLPIATHIGSGQPPKARPDDQVWAEVEMAADRDWQSEADRRGVNESGRFVASRAQISDQVPVDGYYRYKTNPNMTGNWLIGGSIKVNRILSDDEVKAINDRAGVADLPREKPFDAEAYGLETQYSRRSAMAGALATAISASPVAAALPTTPIPVSSPMYRSLESGNARQAMEWLSQNSVSPESREIAQIILRNGLGDARTVVLDPSLQYNRTIDALRSAGIRGESISNVLDGNVLGMVSGNPTDKSIFLFKSSDPAATGVNEETFVHEAIHAYVKARWDSISFYNDLNEKLLRERGQYDDEVIAEVSRFSDHWRKFSDIVVGDLDGGSSISSKVVAAAESPNEALSYILTSPEVQEYAKRIVKSGDGYRLMTEDEAAKASAKANKRTWWSDFVDMIRRAFGLKNPSQTPFFDEFLSAGYSVLKAGSETAPDFRVAEARDAQYSRRNLENVYALRSAPNFARTPMNFDGAVDEVGKLDDVIRKLQDRNIDTKRVQSQIEKAGRSISDEQNVYQTEELYHGKATKRSKDFVLRELNPLLKEMGQKGITTEALDNYLHARHAKERNAQIAKINGGLDGPGSGMTDSEADSYMAGLAPMRKRQLEGLASKVDEMIRETQRMLVSDGLENQTTIDNWNRTYQFYVPLQREGFEDDPQSAGQGMSVRGSSTRRAMGSTLAVTNILSNVAQAREQAISRGERNRVGNALMGLALANPNESFWMVVDPSSKATQRAIDKLVDWGFSPEDAQNIFGPPQKRYIDSKGEVIHRNDRLFANAQNVMATRINGEDRFIIFNPRNPRAKNMVESLKGLNTAQMREILGAVGKVTRYIASINTQYNPIFGMLNLIRDLQGAALNLSTTPIAGKQADVLADAWPAMMGIYSELRAGRRGEGPAGYWANLADEFESQGGKTGYRELFATPADRAKSIEKELNKDVRNVPMKVAGATFEWLSDFNETIENGVRLSAYKHALDAGLSKAQAASLAKNLTVNFNRKGTVGAQAGALYAFFNASVQGTARLAETLTGPAGRRIVVGGLLLGAAQSMMMAMAGIGDDIPDWVKDRNVIIPIGGKKYFTFPLPLGFHAIPATSRRIIDAFTNDDPAAMDVANLLTMYAEAFNPVGQSSIAQTISPTVFDWGIALAENRDFAGRRIYKENMNSLDPAPGPERNKEGVSPLGAMVAIAVDRMTGGTGYTKGVWSPTGDQVDYVVGFFTGGVGREALKVLSTGRAVVTGEELPIYKVPLFGRFFGNANESFSIFSRYYDNISLMNRHEREVDGRTEDGKDPTDYLSKNPEAYLYEEAGNVERQVKALRKQAEQEEDATQKRYLNEEATMLMQEFNQRVADAKRTG